jgi:hypothetical protein
MEESEPRLAREEQQCDAACSIRKLPGREPRGKAWLFWQLRSLFRGCTTRSIRLCSNKCISIATGILLLWYGRKGASYKMPTCIPWQSHYVVPENWHDITVFLIKIKHMVWGCSFSSHGISVTHVWVRLWALAILSDGFQHSNFRKRVSVLPLAHIRWSNFNSSIVCFG